MKEDKNEKNHQRDSNVMCKCRWGSSKSLLWFDETPITLMAIIVLLWLKVEGKIHNNDG